MPELPLGLFAPGFLPHGWCYRWQPGIVWLHVVSDLLIALAYYCIPISLIYIVRRRRDLVYPWMFWLFGAFILACGTTHLMSVIVVWEPLYRLDGVIKAITAVASVFTAALMLRVAPSIVAIPSPEELRRLNVQLQLQIAERKAAETQVRRLNADLEERVRERTRELEAVNAKLRESENRLLAILDSSPTLVYLKNLEGAYQFVNRRFEETFGLSRREAIGLTDYDLFPADAADAYRSADEAVVRTRQPHEVEELAVLDGKERTYMSIKFPLFHESGEPYALCGISSDITERKRSEQALRRYNTELEEFAYAASHDLQEPLRTVKSYTQLLVRRYRSRLDSDADEFLAFIAGGVERMQALITGLQSYSELNRPQLAVDPVDTEAVLLDTVRHMSLSIAEAGAIVTNAPLPQVRVSAAQLGQLFQNLVGNAIKYRRAGEPPRIHITAQSRGLEWEFAVTDNGIGVDMQFAGQIFRVFRRLHGPSVPGAGIGLAICKKIVESYGGRIWVVSEPGAGAEFHFTLPS